MRQPNPHYENCSFDLPVMYNVDIPYLRWCNHRVYVDQNPEQNVLEVMLEIYGNHADLWQLPDTLRRGPSAVLRGTLSALGIDSGRTWQMDYVHARSAFRVQGIALPRYLPLLLPDGGWTLGLTRQEAKKVTAAPVGPHRRMIDL